MYIHIMLMLLIISIFSKWLSDTRDIINISSANDIITDSGNYGLTNTEKLRNDDSYTIFIEDLRL